MTGDVSDARWQARLDMLRAVARAVGGRLDGLPSGEALFAMLDEMERADAEARDADEMAK